MKNTIRTLQRGRRLVGLSVAAVLGLGVLAGTPTATVEQLGMEASAVQVAVMAPVWDAEQVIGAQFPWRVFICVVATVNPQLGWLLGPPCWKYLAN